MRHTGLSVRDMKKLHSRDCKRRLNCLKGNYCECFESEEEDNNKYRSKKERIVAEYLHRCHIKFEYECKNHLKYWDDKDEVEKSFKPDFCIKRARFGGRTLRNVHIEYLGVDGKDKESYHLQNQKKYTEYWEKNVNKHCTIICVVKGDLPNLAADDIAQEIENCELTRKLLTYKDDTVNFAPDWIQVLDPRNKEINK